MRPHFLLTIPGEAAGNMKNWRVPRRQIRVRLVIRGAEPRKLIDVSEIFRTGGTTGFTA